LEAAQLPGSLPDADAAVINTDYANVLAVNAGEDQDPRVQALARALNSPQVRAFIYERYKGSIVPAF